MATLIKIDRNGSKHYEGMVVCPKCGGRGLIVHHMENGQPSWQWTDGGICWKCGGKGKVFGKWVERTPEYQAKLDAKRAEKEKAIREEQERLLKEKEAEEERARAEKAEMEARIKAEKAISQYVGKAGEKMDASVTLDHIAKFTRKAYMSPYMETVKAYTFKDGAGNKLVWFTTGRGVAAEEGAPLTISFTVKEHKDYKDEKQTVITRVKAVGGVD